MKLYVISGGPGVGKTAVINELKKQGYKTVPEAARELALSDHRFIGKSIRNIDQDEFQQAIFEKAKKDFEDVKKLKVDEVFFDRGFGDLIAYDELRGVEPVEGLAEFAEGVDYDKVFILAPLPNYVNDTLRMETREEQEEIQERIINVYGSLETKDVVMVPFMSIKERVDFILANI